ncbi:hypothetical protein BDF22DRAFT_652044 [Syncephalis plumigaleata]|nr:hypothetical protein BDF22DRAFT_652044 [Syncephalis plumigaleata]
MMFKTAIVAAALAALATIVSAGPSANYIGSGAYRLVNADNGYCLNTRGGTDPWFDRCHDNDPLAFELLWLLERQAGGYWLIRNVQNRRCIEEGGKAVRMPECNPNNPKQLWRFHNENNNRKYRKDEYKIISKQSDLRNNRSWTCLESDSHKFFETHTINMKCDVNNRRQFFLRRINPGLPRT